MLSLILESNHNRIMFLTLFLYAAMC